MAVPTNKVLKPWADQIHQWIKSDRLKLTRIQELLAQRRCMVAYTSLRRFVIRKGWEGKTSCTTVRMAEGDFGRLGLMWDPESGRRRLAWGMLIALGHSHHQFLWPMFRQQLVDVIEGLDACWAFFKDKPKVERGIPYARERFFKGGEFDSGDETAQQHSAYSHSYQYLNRGESFLAILFLRACLAPPSQRMLNSNLTLSACYTSCVQTQALLN